MKALILAAGLGTRLCPITDNIPKPLVVLGDQPLLWYHLESLRKNGVTEVLINTHYLPEMINGFVADYNNNHQDIKVFTTHEKELLGSAGTLKKNIDFFKDEQDFFVTYGDNLTTIDYDKILDFHVKNNTLATIASYHEKHPESKGIIIHDKNKKIIKFIEKPSNEEIVSNQANGGVYVLNSKIFS
ncbi:MAG: nucleotidyltransferase family protein [bacterium]